MISKLLRYSSPAQTTPIGHKPRPYLETRLVSDIEQKLLYTLDLLFGCFSFSGVGVGGDKLRRLGSPLGENRFRFAKGVVFLDLDLAPDTGVDVKLGPRVKSSSSSRERLRIVSGLLRNTEGEKDGDALIGV